MPTAQQESLNAFAPRDRIDAKFRFALGALQKSRRTTTVIRLIGFTGSSA
jgi:hypothetical protein